MVRGAAILVAAWGAVASAQTTVQIVPARAPRTSDAQAAPLVRAADAALRELSNLEVRPAAGSSVSARCDANAPDCWSKLAKRAKESLALVVAVDHMAKPTASIALVDLHAGVVGVATADTDSMRAAVEGLLPGQWRKGHGGLVVQLASGSRLKVDGRVVVPDQESKLFLPVGLHEVDLLLPGGKALMTRAEVSEGRLAPVLLDPRLAAEPSRGISPLMMASVGMWGGGALATFASLLVASMANLEARSLEPCAPPTVTTCLSLTDANRVKQRVGNFLFAADVLLWAGGASLVAGAAGFTFDVVRTSSK